MISTFLLIERITPHGVQITTDSVYYIEGGQNIVEGDGFSFSGYDLATDTHLSETLAGRPPVLAYTYALMNLVGVHPSVSPIILSIICWVIFILGIVCLTNKMSNINTATFAAAVVSISFPYAEIFNSAWTEVMYLPILIGVLIVIYDIPNIKGGRLYSRLLQLSTIVSLLIFIRYSGIVVAVSILTWWFIIRIKRISISKLVLELIILSLPLVVFMLWLFANDPFVTGGSGFGNHFSTNISFKSIIVSDVISGALLIIPSATIFQIIETFGMVSVFIYLLPLGMFIRYAKLGIRENKTGQNDNNIAYFIFVFSIFTIVFHSVLPLISISYPFREIRYFAPLMVVAQISFLVFISRIVGRKIKYVILSYTIFIFIILLSTSIIPLKDGLALSKSNFPIQILDRHSKEFGSIRLLSNRHTQVWHEPDTPRSRDLIISSPELANRLKRMGTDTIIFSNAKFSSQGNSNKADYRGMYCGFNKNSIHNVKLLLDLQIEDIPNKVFIILAEFDSWRPSYEKYFSLIENMGIDLNHEKLGDFDVFWR